MMDHARHSSDITVYPLLPTNVSDLVEEARHGQ